MSFRLGGRRRAHWPDGTRERQGDSRSWSAAHAGLARFVGRELPTLGGALLGAIVFIAVFKQGRPVRNPDADDGHVTVKQGMPALLIAAPLYLMLVVLIITTRLIPPVQQVLQMLAVSWEAAGFAGSMQVLYHPGSMLVVSFLAGAVIQKASCQDAAATMTGVAPKIVPGFIALIALLELSRIMMHAGMIDALALAVASSAGSLWPLFVPALGTLGTFVTGSATASIMLFTRFQVAAAERLGLPVLAVIGAQNLGASIGNIISPHNTVAASATVQITGREGHVLRRTPIVALVYLLLEACWHGPYLPDRRLHTGMA